MTLWEIIPNSITAVATAVMAVFTIVLTKVTKRQAQLTHESIELSRKEFIAAYPPEIVVHRISIHGNEDLPLAQTAQAPRIQFIVVNKGRTCAHVVESNASVAWTQTNLPAIPPFNASGNNCLGNPTFNAGFSNSFCIPLPAQRGNGALHFFGYIMYKDDIGNLRRTAFCYRLNGDRFSPLNDPEYNYNA